MRCPSRGGSETLRFDAAGAVRAYTLPDPNDNGRVYLELWVGEVRYGPSPSAGQCESRQFLGNRNFNDLTHSHFCRDAPGCTQVPLRRIRRLAWKPTSTSWEQRNTTTHTILSDWHGADVRVQVWSNLRDAQGSLVLLGLDDLRVRHRP